MKPAAVLCLALALCAVAQHAARGADEGAEQKLVTLTLAVPQAAQDGQLGAPPPALAALLAQGWRVDQCTSLGKTADGKGFVVALLLDRDSPREGGRPQADAGADAHQPGRATPVAAAKPGNYHIVWDDGTESLVKVGKADGLKNPALVTTRDKAGQVMATYQATAFVDDQGSTHIDGRGATVGGPQAQAYSPDSFAIHRDGTVEILDDQDHAEQGVLVVESGPGRREGGEHDAGERDL
jgi:hypothetical protein